MTLLAQYSKQVFSSSMDHNLYPLMEWCGRYKELFTQKCSLCKKIWSYDMSVVHEGETSAEFPTYNSFNDARSQVALKHINCLQMKALGGMGNQVWDLLHTLKGMFLISANTLPLQVLGKATKHFPLNCPSLNIIGCKSVLMTSIPRSCPSARGAHRSHVCTPRSWRYMLYFWGYSMRLMNLWPAPPVWNILQFTSDC